MTARHATAAQWFAVLLCVQVLGMAAEAVAGRCGTGRHELTQGRFEPPPAVGRTAALEQPRSLRAHANTNARPVRREQQRLSRKLGPQGRSTLGRSIWKASAVPVGQ